MIPPVLAGRTAWQRVVDAWVDNTHEDAFTHTVRLADPEMAVEVSAVALPPPVYELRAMQVRSLRGALDPAVEAGLPKLAGTAMVAGLGRRVADAIGTGAGAVPVRDAVVEIARLARQVTKLPRERAVRAAGNPRACWELDVEGWTELPDSCFTYSEAGRRLLGTRRVASPVTADLYSPRPGQARVFVRKKIAHLERDGDRLLLRHSMYDNVHGFELTLEVDVATGRIAAARSLTPRLPYAGICSEPQRKVGALVGEPVDAGLGRRIQTLIGGVTGCAQLYDLTADLLKLLAFDPAAGAARG